MDAQGLGTGEGGKPPPTKLNKYIQASFWQFSSHYFLSLFLHHIQCTYFQGFCFSSFSLLISTNVTKEISKNKTCTDALGHIHILSKCWPFPRRLRFANKTALQATGQTNLYSFKFLKAFCAIIFGFNSKVALWRKLSHL